LLPVPAAIGACPNELVPWVRFLGLPDRGITELAARCNMASAESKICGMDRLADLETALLDFKVPFSGDLPTYVRESNAISQVAKERFAEVWTEAFDIKHWQADLAASAQNVEALLKEHFPEIGPATLEAVVNSAAFYSR
jgi:hypothetical protein